MSICCNFDCPVRPRDGECSCYDTCLRSARYPDTIQTTSSTGYATNQYITVSTSTSDYATSVHIEPITDCYDTAQYAECEMSQYIVPIKHTKASNRRFWFAIPEYLLSEIHENARVICKTRNGLAAGFVSADPFTLEDSKARAERQGAKFPLSEIVGVVCNLDRTNVHVPKKYSKRSRPSAEKLISRIKEYYAFGAFLTQVSVDDQDELTDGYSAYLVAKMFDLPSIPYVYSKQLYDGGNEHE